MLPRYFCRDGQSHIPPHCPSRDLGLISARSRLLVGLDHGNAVPRPWGSCSSCARSRRQEQGNLGEPPVPAAAPSGSSTCGTRPGLRARPRGQQGHIPAWIGQGIVPQDGSCVRLCPSIYTNELHILEVWRSGQEKKNFQSGRGHLQGLVSHRVFPGCSHGKDPGSGSHPGPESQPRAGNHVWERGCGFASDNPNLQHQRGMIWVGRSLRIIKFHP